MAKRKVEDEEEAEFEKERTKKVEKAQTAEEECQ